MKQQMERIRQHVKEHKTTYLVASSMAVVTIGVGIGAYALGQKNAAGVEIVPTIKQIGFGHKATQTIITFVERSNASKPVHLVGTNCYYDSIHEAARALGLDRSQVSKNVNGLIDQVKGYVFEFAEPLAA